MINKVFLIGNLTKDPELSATSAGINYCKFSIAVQRKYAGENGERETDFIPLVAWKGQAELCCKYLKKGSKVAVVGSFQTGSYSTKDGVKKYVSQVNVEEIEFLSTKGHRGEDNDDFDKPIKQEKEGFDPSTVDDSSLPF